LRRPRFDARGHALDGDEAPLTLGEEGFRRFETVSDNDLRLAAQSAVLTTVKASGAKRD
jgi:hypothetical protein